MSTWEVIKSPGVAVVLYLTGHMALIALGYTAGLLRSFIFFLLLPFYSLRSDQSSLCSGLHPVGHIFSVILSPAHRPFNSRFGRPRIYPSANIIFPRTRRTLTSYLAFPLPSTPTSIRNRRCSSCLYLPLADIHGPKPCCKFYAKTGMDDGVLDHDAFRAVFGSGG